MFCCFHEFFPKHLQVPSVLLLVASQMALGRSLSYSILEQQD